jgi:nucleoside 2-deoxyribosyltransferase
MAHPRVYLAGPEVFARDFDAMFRYRERYCESKGLTAVIPFDNRLDNAEGIYRNNLRCMDSADAIVANITPFRGPHADLGTAFEIGYGTARKLPIWAFSSDPRKLFERIPSPKGDGRDQDDMMIEPFGLGENLMIACALYDLQAHSSFEAAVDAAAGLLCHQKS